MLGTPLNSSD